MLHELALSIPIDFFQYSIAVTDLFKARQSWQLCDKYNPDVVINHNGCFDL